MGGGTDDDRVEKVFLSDSFDAKEITPNSERERNECVRARIRITSSARDMN